MRKFRCRAGDLALVIYDVPECLDNVGRIVRVRGPVMFSDRYGKWCWLIRPVVKRPYMVERADGLHRCTVLWKHKVEHPDDWLLPLRPKTASEYTASSRPQPVLTELELSLERLHRQFLDSSAHRPEP